MLETLDEAKAKIHKLLVFFGAEDDVVDEVLYQIDVEHEFVENHKVAVNLAELEYVLIAFQRMHLQVAVY